MTKQLSRLLLCALLVGLLSAWVTAQDTDAKSKGSVRSLTGCLTKGDSADEFRLTANDGSTWEIRANNTVDLASQVDRSVEVKGVVQHNKMHNMKEDAKEAAKDTGMKKSDTEHGHLEVTDVRRVGETCQK